MKLETTYMGMSLKNPLVASASPLSEDVDTIRRLEDAGAAGVVMFSLFEEQLRYDATQMENYLSAGVDSFAESLSFFPEVGDFRVDPSQYLDILHRASESVEIPVMASLNGTTREGWTQYAAEMQQAGAKGIELNIYYIPTDMGMTGTDVEKRYLDILGAVKEVVTVPVAVKLSPFFSSMANMAALLDDAGANALVLFNRFYQPDFNLDHLKVEPSLHLSTADEIRLPLLWIAVLKGRINASLAATRGVEGADEVIKYILAGADIVTMASVLLRQGPGYVSTILKDMTEWMEAAEYESVDQMRGAMSQQSVADPRHLSAPTT
jgi:dihydroorotate dehydrogenase (fumarate)